MAGSEGRRLKARSTDPRAGSSVPAPGPAHSKDSRSLTEDDSDNDSEDSTEDDENMTPASCFQLAGASDLVAESCSGGPARSCCRRFRGRGSTAAKGWTACSRAREFSLCSRLSGEVCPVMVDYRFTPSTLAVCICIRWQDSSGCCGDFQRLEAQLVSLFDRSCRFESRGRQSTASVRTSSYTPWLGSVLPAIAKPGDFADMIWRKKSWSNSMRMPWPCTTDAQTTHARTLARARPHAPPPCSSKCPIHEPVCDGVP